ncbi:MAG: iron-sulfur cluster assembly scaffold protein [Planctomycetaceae bacterium]|jgi:NifU-like protein|nr:iron-sulfur cluster assembly scaffold protein [Planctomycetaceae bacterium]
MGWEYSEKTKQLFMDAIEKKPGTHIGEIENPDGFGEHGSIACGDSLRFTFRVQQHPEDPLKDIITEANYLTFGCTSAIAASEALCVIIEERNLTPVQALKVTNQDIVDYLDGLPEQKIHCSVMGAEALEAAVFDWAQKRGVDLRKLGIDVHQKEQEEGRLVCKCFNITEPYLKRKIKELNLRTIPEITGAVKAGGACMSCHHVSGGLQDILNEVWGNDSAVSQPATGTVPGMMLELPVISGCSPPSEVRKETVSVPKTVASDSAAPLSPFQFGKKVERVINETIRPMLLRDGGNIEIVDIKDTVVYLSLTGACSSCAGAGQTLKLIVEKTLKDQVDEHLRVIQV